MHCMNIATGDKGQRYEHLCDDENGEPMVCGWSNAPDTAAIVKLVELHPCWSNHRAVDRQVAPAPQPAFRSRTRTNQ